MCYHEKQSEFTQCPACGADSKQIEYFKNPEIIRLELHNGGHYVSIYKEGYFGYVNCRIFGEIIGDMDREKQFYLSHPDDLTWKIKGCAGTKNPTTLNGNDITENEMSLNANDLIEVGNLQLTAVFVFNE